MPFKVHMYPMHSNVSLRYPPGTSMYFYCVWLLSDPCEVVGGPKGPRIVHLYPKEGHWPRTYSNTRRSSESGRSESGSEGVGDQPEGLKANRKIKRSARGSKRPAGRS